MRSPLAFLMALPLAIVGATGASQAQTSTTTPCVAITVESIPATPPSTLGYTFSAAKILDLRFNVLLKPTTSEQIGPLDRGAHYVELKITGPKGNEYQSISVPFSAGTQTAGALVSVPSYPKPVEVRKLASVKYNLVSYPAVSASMPVAGTAIVDNGLYGKWKVVAYLDGAQTICGSPVRFSITR